MRTALVLLFLLALAAIPGSLIPQQKVDASAVAAFRSAHPSLAPWFDRLGMFSVYTSPWFSAVYLLLMVSLIGCFIPRLRLYAKATRARPPKAPRNLARFSSFDSYVTDATPGDVSERARSLLSAQRRRVDVYEDGSGGVVVAAEKGYLREAGNLVFHFAVLVVLVGLAITSLYGFKGGVAVVQGESFSNTLIQYDDFSPGGRFRSSQLAPFSFKVDTFSAAYKPTEPGRGTPLHFDAGLTVRDQPGATPYRYDLRVNHPLQVDGTSVFLVGHGYAPVITVRDGKGNIAYSGPVVFLPLDGTFTSYGVVKAPDAQPTQLGLEGYFFPTGAVDQTNHPVSIFPGLGNPVISFVAYHGNLGLDSGVPQSVYVLDKKHLKTYDRANGRPKVLLLKVGDSARLKDGSVRFDGVRPWVKLQISHSPGKLVPLSGVLLAIAGLLGSLFIRPRRTWVRATPGAGGTLVEIAVLDRASGGNPDDHVDQVSSTLQAGEDSA